MIVRNEADVIAAALRSALPLIDTWVICDTGSTDGTQALIAEELASVPGELHEHEWVDFATNRTRLMDLARGKADYLLVLDADNTIEAAPDALAGLEADAYHVRHDDGGVEYHSKSLVSGRLPWRYAGVVHEYIESPEERSTGRLDNVVMRAMATGGSRHGRWERDAQLLEAAIAKNPQDERSRFYLAQTYRDLARDRSGNEQELMLRALQHYEARAEMRGWPEETYAALLEAGRLYNDLGNWPAAADAFTRAWEERPQRLEAVWELARGLNERQRFRAAHRFTSLAADRDGLPVPDDLLFVTRWIYDWGLLFEHSIAAYWIGDYRASAQAGKKLLLRRDLPEPYQQAARKNLEHALREHAREAAELQVPPRNAPWAHAGRPTRGKER